MAAHIIEKGKHYDTDLFSSFPHLFQKEFKKDIQFCANCDYDIGSYHQQDNNKLFGACFGLRSAHYNSARFGWWWDVATEEMVLTAYCYDKGKRNSDAQLLFPEVARLKLKENYSCLIRVTPTDYVFHVTQGDYTIGQVVTIPHSKLSFFGWTLSLFWGGETVAPKVFHVFIN